MTDNTQNAPEFLIIAGEPSGDMHGADFVRELKAKIPDCSLFGIGGELLRKEGVEIIFPVEKMAILGFVEVLKHLPFIKKVFSRIIHEVIKRSPKAVILIDYPGFNIRLAKKIRKRFGSKIKIFYYISPQIWAWKKKRIVTIAKTIDAMAVVFPFEKEMYQEMGVKTRFVGHPLLEKVVPLYSKEEFFRLIARNPENITLGLLPGSRQQEIKRHLPDMIGAIDLLNREFENIQAIIGTSPYIESDQYQQLTDSCNIKPVFTGNVYDVMRHSNILIVSSGTATLEAGLSGTPMIIIYKVSPLTYFIAKQVVKLPFIGLINIVHGSMVVPELIQNEANSRQIVGIASGLLSDSTMYDNMKNRLKNTASLLGNPGAAERAAELFVEIL